MKLITLLMTVTLIQVSAATFGQRVTLMESNVTMERVFREIRKQTGYHVLFKDTDLLTKQRISVQFNDTPIEQAVEYLADAGQLAYEITDKTILMRKRETRVGEVPRQTAAQQPITIRGKVTDSLNLPLRGVTVSVVGTGRQTMTDKDGVYEITGVPQDATLQFRLLSYETLEVPANGDIVNVVLKPVVSEIEEVEVNAGYWKVSDKLRTGNISRVTSETISQHPVGDPMMALMGRVPGLQVTQQSGFPGADMIIRLRGMNSLSNGNNPLFIVDGVPFPSTSLTVYGGASFISPFSTLNPNEIESIEVLKDADATAIYGSRGANGVILITTKTGKPGSTKVNLNLNTGIGQVANKLDLMNTEQYLEMRREAFANDGITNYPANAYDLNGRWDMDRYTDWQELFLGGTSSMTNIQTTISGGNTNTQFMVGGGFLLETPVYIGDYSDRKASAHFSLNHTSTNNRFSIVFSGRYLKDNNRGPAAYNAFATIFLPPNAPALYDEDGNLNWENNTWVNPMASLNARNKTTTKNFIANTSIVYEFVAGLKGKVNLGYNEILMNESKIEPSSSLHPNLAAIPTMVRNLIGDNSISTWIVEPQLSYLRQVGKGTLNAMIGTTFQESLSYILSKTASGFSDDALIENIAAATTIRVDQNRESQYRYTSFFGRINYNWQEKYLVNAVMRRDGSTRFGANRKFGNFGSIGAAWIFSNETWLNDVSGIFSYGKLRGSYGTTGNDQLTDYQYLSTYSSYNVPYLGVTGLFPTRISNPDFRWEMVRKWEAGLDLGFFKDRILLNTSYYLNRTGNQLVGYSLPTLTGFSSVQANLPAIIQNSGLETELNTINIQGNNFNWNSSANITLPRNRLIAYPDIENSSYRNRYEVGKSLFVIKGFHYTGVDPETGMATFEDVNRDGLISSPHDLLPVIEISQMLFGGLANNFTYKGIQLDVFFQFVKQKGRHNSGGVVPGTAYNQPVSVLQRWRQHGDTPREPKFTQSGEAFQAMSRGLNSSDMYVVDASFIRLKNLALSYRLPKAWQKHLLLEDSRIYVQCQNLFTITNYPGLDPETQGGFPAVRMMTAGIDITF